MELSCLPPKVRLPINNPACRIEAKETFGMNEIARSVWFWSGILVVGFASLLLAFDPWLARKAGPTNEQFQRLVGGLGMGPATTLAADESRFDPRVSATSTLDLAPVPGGGWLGGAEACSILPFRSVFVAGAAASPREPE